MSSKPSGRFEIDIEIKSKGFKLEDPAGLEKAVVKQAEEMSLLPTVVCVRVVSANKILRVARNPDAARDDLLKRGHERLARIYEEGDERVRADLAALLEDGSER